MLLSTLALYVSFPEGCKQGSIRLHLRSQKERDERLIRTQDFRKVLKKNDDTPVRIYIG